MNRMATIIEGIKSRLQPTDAERSAVEAAAKEIETRLKRAAVHYELGGSYAHGTWLPGSADLDYFLLYSPEIGATAIARAGMTDAETVLKGYTTRRRFAEHPYLEGYVGGIRVNLVPCADAKPGNWVTSMDRSRYHSAFMKEHLNEEMKGEVRVAKAFLKARGLYGAEIRIAGFSGYLTEVLIVKYGSFLQLIKAATVWKKGEMITIDSPSSSVKQLFQAAPLIVIDPVDPRRNLAQAVRPANIGNFIMLSRSFIRKPRASYFRKAARGGGADVNLMFTDMLDHTAQIIFPSSQKVEDIRWGEYKKSLSAITGRLKEMGYPVIKAIISEKGEWASFAILLQNTDGIITLRKGPSTFDPENSSAFLHANRRFVWVADDGNVYTMAKKGPVEAIIKHILKRPVENGISKGIANSTKASVVTVGLQINELKGTKKTIAKLAMEELVRTGDVTDLI